MSKSNSREGVSHFHQFCFTPNALGTNVHMGVKVWSTDDEPFTGLDTSTDYHVVFKDSCPRPTPYEMADAVPPAQRKDLPVVEGMPGQANVRVRETAQEKAIELMEKGVKICCQKRRVPDEAVEDLNECLALLKDRSDLAFDWDTTMYEEADRKLNRVVSTPVVSPGQSPVSSPVQRPASPNAPPVLELNVQVGDFVLLHNAPEGDEPFFIGQMKSLPKLWPECEGKDSTHMELEVRLCMCFLFDMFICICFSFCLLLIFFTQAVQAHVKVWFRPLHGFLQGGNCRWSPSRLAKDLVGVCRDEAGSWNSQKNDVQNPKDTEVCHPRKS